ncbi:MAG: zinc ribbon domain-containing protein [Symbiobacteriia bacterium]
MGWSQFKTFLQSKAAAAGRRVIEKNPWNTSQECSGCGQLVPKKLHVRWHQCECGTSLHRDHNAAIRRRLRSIDRFADERAPAGRPAGASALAPKDREPFNRG